MLSWTGIAGASQKALLLALLLQTCTAFYSTSLMSWKIRDSRSKRSQSCLEPRFDRGCLVGGQVTQRRWSRSALQMVDAAPVMDAAPMLDASPAATGAADGGTQPVVDLRRPNTATTLVLMSWFLLIVGIPTAYYITGAPPSAHLLPHMLAGSGAGMIAVSLCYPLQQLRNIKWEGGFSRGVRLLFTGLGLVLAAQGILKAISSISYAYFHSLVQSGAVQGLAAVAQASLATGVIVGLVSTPLERAQRVRKGNNLVDNLSELARQGLFSRQGLYGEVGAVITINVVSFEAFYLSYHWLLAVFPWVGAGMIGTAVGGAASGVVALLAGQSLSRLLELLSSVGAPQDTAWESAERASWRVRMKAFGQSASLVALNSSLLFVFYRALFLVLSP